MAALSNILHYIVPNNFLASLHLHQHRRVTVRHVLLILGMSAVLSTLYYVYLRRDQVSLSLENVHFWPPETPEIWAERTAHVKEAFQHAYHGYEQFALPQDELMPISNKSVNNFNGWAVTLVDSLDTMLLMGLDDEYKRTFPVIRNTNFSLPSNNYVPFFETVIRYLGGLLSAYAISGDELMREKADELGRKLSPAFNTTTGFPGFAVDTFKGSNFTWTAGVLAEIASCQMEYAYLGKITGKREYVDHATLITSLFHSANLSLSGGMYPTHWNLRTGAPTRVSLSVGALADSGHEYTLKQFLMTARTDKRNLEMYIRFTSFVINNLLFLTPERRLLYVTDASRYKRWLSASHSFEHLACFFPGLLALGAHLLPLDRLDTLGINATTLADDLLPGDRRAYTDLSEFNLADLHLWAAQGIGETCYLMYADQPTGLGPEVVRMDVDELGEIRWMDALREWKASEDRSRGHWWDTLSSLLGVGWGPKTLPPGVGDMDPWINPLKENVTVESMVRAGRRKGKDQIMHTFGRDYLIKNTGYYLRPETIESIYILWRTTGDIKWRHRGWQIFQSIERYTKTESGYASIYNVDTLDPGKMDSMPSYFLAETLKYLYLLFSDDDLLPLENWVFNTEAHPLPVFEWSKEEREAFGIP